MSGACDVDVPLTVGVTGAMICFALFAQAGSPSRAGTGALHHKGTVPDQPSVGARSDENRDSPPPMDSPLRGRRMAWGRAMFLALAVGMLAKGPVALVLTGLAVAAWLVLVRRWRLVIELPWISGLFIFFLVAGPWYLLAERATPGFLHYFFVVENFRRYLFNEYGDQFGFGRLRPYGAIWLFFFGAMLPWTVLAAAALGRLAMPDVAKLWCKFHWTEPRLGWSGVILLLRKFAANDPWLAYALIWGLVPPLFFTLARQVVWTYVLPGLPGMAIATARGIGTMAAIRRRGGAAEGPGAPLRRHRRRRRDGRCRGLDFFRKIAGEDGGVLGRLGRLGLVCLAGRPPPGPRRHDRGRRPVDAAGLRVNGLAFWVEDHRLELGQDYRREGLRKLQ